ncbi:MAG: hypothetical protein QM784_36690 [Polyangiaceae bacterium]
MSFGEQGVERQTRLTRAADTGEHDELLLSILGCRVTAVPATTSAEEILALNPDGIFLSNGPGDPAPVTYAIDTIETCSARNPCSGSASVTSSSGWPSAEAPTS